MYAFFTETKYFPETEINEVKYKMLYNILLASLPSQSIIY